MANLFKAFLFKLRRDLTFRITLFVGLGLAIFLTLIYLGIDMMVKISLEPEQQEVYKFAYCNGQNLFIGSLSPAQNFGIAIPVNLITFTVLEFTHGSIRNKIIAGNSKAKIYFSLLLSGLVFTFALLIAYSLLCLGLGSIIGGFDPYGICPGDFLWKIILLAIFAYIFITAMTIFFATLFRNIGPSIPVVILLIMGMYLLSSIFGGLGGLIDGNDTFKSIAEALKYINPIHTLGSVGINTLTGSLSIDDSALIAEIINNIVLSAAFTVGGVLIFKRRDVK